MTDTVVVLLTAGLTASACALVGVFLLLRRLSLMGDAISHSILPGLVLAFLFTGSLDPLLMLAGAAVCGVLTALLIQWLTQTGLLYDDASIGAVFPAMFALGVLVLTLLAGSAHLDSDCVLFGKIEFVPFETVGFAGGQFPRALLVMGIVTGLNLLLVVGLWKELKIGTFDPQLAASLGFAPGLVNALLMSAVSLTTVAAFECVGAVLVVALLVVPPATAFLLTQRLGTMVVLAVAVGVASAVGGYAMARAATGLNFSVAGSMSLAAGMIFALAWLLAPRQGMLAQWQSRRALAGRLEGELLLSRLPTVEPGAEPAEMAGRLGWTQARTARVAHQLVAEGRARLSPTGRWVAMTASDQRFPTP